MTDTNDSSLFSDIIGETVEQTKEEAVETVDNSTEQKDDTEGEESEKTETDPAEETKTDPEETEVTEVAKETEESPDEEKEVEVEELDAEFSEIGKEIDPEAEYKDKSSLASAIKGHISSMKEELDALNKANKEVYDVLSESPAIADFMRDVIHGMDPIVAAGIHISETLAPEEGEKSFEDYKAKRNEIKAKQAEKQKALDEYNKNAKTSSKTMESFIQKSKMKKDEFQPLTERTGKMIEDINNGVLSEDFLTMILRDAKYEQDVKDAEERGFLRGQNQKIKLVKDKARTDGMPGLTSSQSKVKEQKAQPSRDPVDSLLGM
jgi:hypothetical protein